MNIIAVDDERPALRALEQAIETAVPNACLAGFTSVPKALEYAGAVKTDVAFLDIEMAEIGGLLLAKKLKDIHGGTNIIFVTAYSKYAMDALSLHASGYLLKPAGAAAIARELENLRHPPAPPAPARVRVTCFGGFGIFVNGAPLLFSRPKVKELLAYLVHKKGAAATNAEIAAILWEDKSYTPSLQSQTRKVLSLLRKSLREAGIEDILCKGWNSVAINVPAVSCDLFDYLQAKPGAVNAYTGEYLNEYSWAEFTVEYLNHRSYSDDLQ
ncbi:response regulator [Clostridia bacterium OttesenSCG-928-O13]|nr:response regulator [Clostridia bacterium OttesenSCG-928-O13]